MNEAYRLTTEDVDAQFRALQEWAEQCAGVVTYSKGLRPDGRTAVEMAVDRAWELNR